MEISSKQYIYIFFLSGWPNTATGCPERGYGISILADIRKPFRNSPGQFAIADPDVIRGLEHVNSRVYMYFRTLTRASVRGFDRQVLSGEII